MSDNISIKRVNSYCDSRFSQTVLNQHGAFIVNDEFLYEIEILNESSACIRGSNARFYEDVIKEFRFYAEHISTFFDQAGIKILEFDPVNVFKLAINQIQPTQFYIDHDKLAAVKSFVKTQRDVIIPVAPFENRFISLDGHTRLSAAAALGFKYVYGFVTESDDYIFDFVKEALSRHVKNVADIAVLSHAEYEEKWFGFCDEYWDKKDEDYINSSATPSRVTAAP